MKTTLDLPDDLMRAVKIRAVEENRKLRDMMADLLRRGLAQKSGVPAAAGGRLKLPLVECAHEARPGEEMVPERVAEVLLEEEAGTPMVRQDLVEAYRKMAADEHREAEAQAWNWKS
jgi:plasmid stability protein